MTIENCSQVVTILYGKNFYLATAIIKILQQVKPSILKYNKFIDKIFLDKLKVIFWTEIIPYIEQYELLDDDSREYFESAEVLINIEDENLRNTLIRNEPQGKGKDFKIFTSVPQNDSNEVEDNQGGMTSEMLDKIKEAFSQPRRYVGEFAWESDSESDENAINIAVNQCYQEDENEEDAKLLIKTFQAVVRFRDDSDEIRHEGLPLPDMKNRLKDPNVLSDMSCFDRLPAGIRAFMSEIPFFSERFDEPQENIQLEEPPIFSHNESQPLDIPVDQSDESTFHDEGISITDHSSSYQVQRRLRSSFLSDFPTTSESAKRAAAVAKYQFHQNSPSTSRSKQNTRRPSDKNPIENWMEDFSSKRRRDSSSPENFSQK